MSTGGRHEPDRYFRTLHGCSDGSQPLPWLPSELLLSPPDPTMGHLVREHEHRSGPGSSVDLAGLGALFLLGAHVVAASACQHGAGRTDDLVDGRVRIRVPEPP